MTGDAWSKFTAQLATWLAREQWSTKLVPRRRRGGRVLDRQCVAWASGGVGAERRAACDAACESLGTWI